MRAKGKENFFYFYFASLIQTNFAFAQNSVSPTFEYIENKSWLIELRRMFEDVSQGFRSIENERR